MNRFRFTILALCLVLLFLGFTDLQLFFNNPEPAVVSISELEQDGGGRYRVRLRSGTSLKLSRGYREQLKRSMGMST